MKRGGWIKRDVQKIKAWLSERSALPKKNVARAKKKYERNFMGDQSKRVGDKNDWLHGLPCEVTGLWPIEAAHVEGARGMGGSGGDATGLVPLIQECHRDFDGTSLPYLTDDQFKAKWGRSRASISARAPYYEELWQKFGYDGGPGDLAF